MSTSRLESLRADTTRHLEQSSRQSGSIKVLEGVVVRVNAVKFLESP